jgi:hypothetical protein
MDETDEFRITASKPGEEDRIWTRSRYAAAKSVAEGAVIELGYVVAKVINTFGGDESDTLYEVIGTGQGFPTKIDHVANEKRP